MKVAVKTFLICLLIAVCSCQQATQPKVGLVLSGGGAKGAAEIGAIKIMEKTGFKPDYIVGTSIGSFIGGMYASGVPIRDIEKLFVSLDRMTMISKDTLEFIIDSVLSAHNVTNFEDTKIPFRCVAVEATLTRQVEEVVLDSGKMLTAIRASMAYPGLFRPVEINGKKLFDGGILNNLPVDVAIDMGAEKIVAVDLQQSETEGLEFSPKDEFGIGGLVDWAFVRPDGSKHRRNVDSTDIYIHPTLQGYNFTSFNEESIRKMIEIGENEARTHWVELQQIKQQPLLPIE